MSREVHLEAVVRVFAYLALHHNARVVFDPTYPSIDMVALINTDWKSMYGDVKEIILPGAPFPRVKEIGMHFIDDSDHAGVQSTR
jgi:hypothetical protein